MRFDVCFRQLSTRFWLFDALSALEGSPIESPGNHHGHRVDRSFRSAATAGALTVQ
jgi:hypothetical protein